MSWQIALIMGMHRSGTSMMAELLTKAGYSPPVDIIPAHADDNPRGYFESRTVVNINNTFLAEGGMTWKSLDPLPINLFDDNVAIKYKNQIITYLEQHFRRHQTLVLKDPRICRLIPLWRPCLEQLHAKIIVIRVIRDAYAVYCSLTRRIKNLQLQPAAIKDLSTSDLLWLRYNSEAFFYTKDLPNLVFTYEKLIKHPRKELDRLARFFQIELTNYLKLTDNIIAAPCQDRHSAPPNRPHDVQALIDDLYLTFSGQPSSIDFNNAWERIKSLAVPAIHQKTIGDHAGDNISLFAQAAWKEISGNIPHTPYKVYSKVPILRRLFSHAQPILFISQNPNARSHIYRVKNPVDALNRLGQPACWFTIKQLANSQEILRNARALIIHRCPWDERIADIVRICRRHRIRVGFDIDDYLIDPIIIEAGWSDYLGSLKQTEQRVWKKRLANLRITAESSDFLLVPTATLGQLLHSLDKPVIEMANGFSPENLALSDFWRSHIPLNDQMIRIGYASGTPTHQADFTQIVHPLTEILNANTNTCLTVVGHLNLSVFSMLPAKQVEWRPLVQHINLAYELARFDINLIPLTRNPFCDAKSPLKYFETALVGVPSIATANPVYQNAINDNDNGLLAANSSEWKSKLEKLLISPILRRKIGEQARSHVIKKHAIDQLIHNFVKYLH